MAGSLTISNSSSRDSKAQEKREEIDKETTLSEACSTVSVYERNSVLKASMGGTWNDALCCEARNSLQVILSGAEILLEDHLGNLLAGQKELLTKMTDNTYHLCNLLSTLLGPEEFKV